MNECNQTDSKRNRKRCVMSIVAFCASIVALAVTLIFLPLYFTIDDLGVLWVWLISLGVCAPLSLFSIILAVVSIVVSTVNQRRRGFAIASIVVSAVAALLAIAMCIWLPMLKFL